MILYVLKKIIKMDLFIQIIIILLILILYVIILFLLLKNFRVKQHLIFI